MSLSQNDSTGSAKLCHALNDELSMVDNSMEVDQSRPLQVAHTSRLTDTADVVREAAKRINKARVQWDGGNTVVIITKPGDKSLVCMTREIALWLLKKPDACSTVYVDLKLKSVRSFKYQCIMRRFPGHKDRLKFWDPQLCISQPKLFDWVITLGGDGTVLFSSWLFQNYVPPVIPFNLGSLGFLTPFEFDRYDKYLTSMIDTGARINLRSRLSCTVYRKVPYPDSGTSQDAHSVKLRNLKRNLTTGKITVGNWCSKKHKKHKLFGEIDGKDYIEDHDKYQESYWNGNSEDDELDQEHLQVPFFTTTPVEHYHVINEIVVDRGPSPFVSLLELFGDDKHLTTVQADGLAISTPTGSTAYSLSAGGSLTHPGIHATLITPICPHTLSFRPTLVPDSMELRVCVPFNSRNTAWASFDGRGRVELKQGDHIKITASKHGFPTVCNKDQSTDWFNSLQQCLHWNRRMRQKSFAIVETSERTAGRGPFPSSTSPRGLGLTPRTPVVSQLPSPPRSDYRRTHYGASTPVTSSSSSTTSPESGSDEIFGMFLGHEDMPRDEDDMDMSDYRDEFDLNADSEQEDQELALTDVFEGWTDDDIRKARFMVEQLASIDPSKNGQTDQPSGISTEGNRKEKMDEK